MQFEFPSHAIIVNCLAEYVQLNSFESFVRQYPYKELIHLHHAYTPRCASVCCAELGNKSLTMHFHKLVKYPVRNYLEKLFVSAVCSGDVDFVRYIFDNIPNICAHASLDEAFRTASKCGFLSIVKYLVEEIKGVDISACRYEVFRNSAKNGYSEVLSYLIEKTPHFKKFASLIFSTHTMECIIEAGFTKVITVLLNYITIFNNSTLLHTAVLNGHLDIIHLFTKSNLIDFASIKNTLFKKAVLSRKLEIVEYFYSFVKPDINFEDYLFFKLAACLGCLDIVKFFVKVGVDVCATNNFAFRYSARNGHHNVMLFLSQQKDAVRWAAARGHSDIVKYLVSKGANPNSRGNQGFYSAIIGEHWDVANMYLNEGWIERTDSVMMYFRSAE
jgi:hypothetical protein